MDSAETTVVANTKTEAVDQARGQLAEFFGGPVTITDINAHAVTTNINTVLGWEVRVTGEPDSDDQVASR